MKVEDAIQANELVTALQDGLEMQRVILEGLRDSLQEYNDFLTMQIRDMQRELGTYDTEVEVVSDCCGAKATGGNDELGGIGRCSFCFEGCIFMKEVLGNE